jgi:hypothetical protein
MGEELAMDQWDAFISHASEDKEAIAIPLAEALRGAGLRVWLDQHELRVGDNLFAKINQGLANSRFGVVVLSPSFLAKDWTNAELGGLMAIKMGGRDVILPVWHGIDKPALVEKAPMLADWVATKTSDGLDTVVSDLLRVILDRDRPGSYFPTVGRLLIELLDSDPEQSRITTFLRAHPQIVVRAFGSDGGARLRWSPTLGGITPDICMGTEFPTTGRTEWGVVVLGRPTDPVVPFPDTPSPALSRALSQLEALRSWIASNLAAARQVLPDIRSGFHGVVVIGRRKRMTPEESEYLRDFGDLLVGTRIRTYDRLVDAALSIDARGGGAR